MAAKENILFKPFVNDYCLGKCAGAQAHLELARWKLVVVDQKPINFIGSISLHNSVFS